MQALQTRTRTRPAFVASLVAVCSVIAAACGSGPAKNSTTAPTTPAPAASASASVTNNNGSLNWEWALPTSWDPVTSTAGWDVHVLSLVYSSITRLDAAGNAGPGLATGWTYGADGRSVTFTLRPNLTFSDGTPLDATAVKASLERGLTQANSTLASQLAVIASVVVDSPTSFTLNLAQVDYQIPNLLGGKTGMIVSPKAFTTDAAGLATQPVGAGPFTLTSYVPDSHANLVRNPGYWDAAHIHLAHFSVLAITDPQQILAALESGQVNVAYIPGTLVSAAKAAGFRIQNIAALPVVELDVQTTVAPFNNPAVIQAINYGIDRQALLQVQQGGYGTISYQPFPKGYVGYNPALANLYPYNPAKAKQLLAQAGFANGVSVTLTNPGGAVDDPLAEQIQSQLKAIGITVGIKEVPPDQATQFMYVNKTLSFDIDGTAGRESPVQMLDVLYDQKGLMNVIGKSAAEPASVSSALQQALEAPLNSPSYATTLQAAVATAVKDDPIHIWLYYTPRIFAVSPKVSAIPSDLVQQRWEGTQVAP